VCIVRFGASGRGDTVMRELGINPENVVERALELLGTGGS
jgi:transketolase